MLTFCSHGVNDANRREMPGTGQESSETGL